MVCGLAAQLQRSGSEGWHPSDGPLKTAITTETQRHRELSLCSLSVCGDLPFRSRELPDPNAVFRRRQTERITRLHVERLAPGINVTECRKGADLAGRLRAVHDLLPERLAAPQGPPDLGPAPLRRQSL